MARSDLPRFLHALTFVHAAGSLVTLVMAIGSAASPAFRDGLVQSPGSAYMVQWFGAWTWTFLLFLSLVLGSLAYGSWRLRRWVWPLTLVVYAIGVLGSLWQVSVGIPQGWVSATINGFVVAYAGRPTVARAYGWRIRDPSMNR